MSRHHKRARWGGQKVTNLRAAWSPLIARGSVVCNLCDKSIRPNQAWDLGHGVALAEGGDANQVTPQHTSCNRSEGGHLGNQIKRARKTRTRKWT